MEFKRRILQALAAPMYRWIVIEAYPREPARPRSRSDSAFATAPQDSLQISAK
jgi:hypothetical protein